jgi:NADPH-dependent glutamate synthase beta subunit-like oxidoreductase
MEAARIATLRGHEVTIFEKTSELGGAILFCCMLPGKNKMRWYADWLRRQMETLGVDVRLDASPRVDELKTFDAVILATGARFKRPDIPGIDSPRVCTFADVLRCSMSKCDFYPPDRLPPVSCGQNVVIWGDHFGAADAAEKLSAQGKQVCVVTENAEFASWMEPCHKDVMLKRFAGGNGEGLNGQPFAHPVRVIPRSTVVAITAEGEVALMDDRFRKSSIQADNVVLALLEPDDALYEGLLEAGVVAIRIGDGKQVRNVRAAVTEGANAGLTLDEGLQLNANRALIANLPTEVNLNGNGESSS